LLISAADLELVDRGHLRSDAAPDLLAVEMVWKSVTNRIYPLQLFSAAALVRGAALRHVLVKVATMASRDIRSFFHEKFSHVMGVELLSVGHQSRVDSHVLHSTLFFSAEASHTMRYGTAALLIVLVVIALRQLNSFLAVRVATLVLLVAWDL